MWGLRGPGLPPLSTFVPLAPLCPTPGGQAAASSLDSGRAQPGPSRVTVRVWALGAQQQVAMCLATGPFVLNSGQCFLGSVIASQPKDVCAGLSRGRVMFVGWGGGGQRCVEAWPRAPQKFGVLPWKD